MSRITLNDLRSEIKIFNRILISGSTAQYFYENLKNKVIL